MTLLFFNVDGCSVCIELLAEIVDSLWTRLAVTVLDETV